jgi:Membrane proteins related to metalloendopeptidases
MPVIGIAELLVQPVFSGAQNKVEREMGRIMPRAGRDAGQKLGKGMADGFNAETAGLEAEVARIGKSVAKAESDVTASKNRMAAASAAESKALGDVRVAELKLQETRDSSNAKASQVAAAEEKLSALRGKAIAATVSRENAEHNLSRTTVALGEAQKTASKASTELETHMKNVSKESVKTERDVDRLGARLSRAFKGSPLGGLVTSIRSDSNRINVDLHKMANDVSQAGTRGGRAFTQAFIGVVGGLSAVTPAAGAAGAALLVGAGNALTLAASLGQLAGVAALVPAGLMAIGGAAGVLVTAFAGVGEALKAATDQQAAFVANPRIAAMAVQDAMQAITVAEENAARSQEQAARRVADAKRSLQDTIESVAEAEKNAAEAIEDAVRRVRDAKRDLQDAIESAAEADVSAAEAQEQAARRVRDAKRDLQDAIERVAEAQVQAARAIETAERREAEAVKDVIDAQKDLAEARDKAANKAAEVSKKLAAADKQAVDTALAYRRATEAYNNAKADPTVGAAQMSQLESNMAAALAADQRAKQSVEDLGKERKAALAEEKKGNEAVQSAEEKLAKARQAEADAVQSRKNAEAKSVKQQRDGVRQIADAQEDISDALKAQKKAHTDAAKSAEDAARRIADAQEGVADSLKDEKDAHADAAKVGADGARQIADAQRAIRDATQDAGQVQVDSARAVDQAHRNLERTQLQQADAAARAGDKSAQAMANLTPAARAAVVALLAVKDRLSEVRKIAQENFFAGFVPPLMALADTVIPQLAVGVGAIATALGAGAQTLMNSLNTAFDGGVLTGLLKGVAQTVTVLNTAIDPLVQSFVTLGVVGMEYMPRLAQWISDIADRFNGFIQASAADGRLVGWIDAGIQGLKDLGSIVGSVSGMFASLTRAAEAGGAVSTLGGLAAGLRDIDAAMKGEVFQTTMSKLFAGAEAGSQGLLDALTAMNQAFVVGADAFSDFLRLGGEISGAFLGGIFTALSNPDFGSGLTTFMEHLRAGVDQIVPLLPGLTGGLGLFLTAMGPIVEVLGPSLIKVFTAFADSLGFVLGVFEPLLVLIAGSPIAMGLLIGAFAATKAASAALTAAGNVQRIMMGLWRGATMAMTAAQKALNLAMKANPIGLVITVIGLLVGALVWLYKNNETARKFMDAAWIGIKLAVQVAWSRIKKVFETLKKWFTVILPAAWGVLKSVNAVAWDAIKKKIGDIWGGIKSWFGSIKYWFTVTLPEAWNLLKAVNKAVWDGIKKKIGDIWTGIKSTFQSIDSFIRGTLATAFKWLRDNLIKPVWDGIKNKISAVWTKGIKPVFQVLGNFIKDHVAPAFKKGVDAVTSAWEKIKSAAKKPVKFVIDKVINGGIIGAFNKVAGFIDPGGKVIKKLAEVNIPGFARGGWTGPGSKYQEAGVVHADEFVIKKESQRDISRKAPGLLDGLNRFGARALGYAGGGLVHPMDPRHRGISAGWHGYPGHLGTDYPAPVGTSVFSPGPGVVAQTGWNLPGGTGKQVWINHENGLMSRVHHLSQWLVKAGDTVKAHQAIGKVGMTGNTTGPHAHWGVMDGRTYMNPASVWGSGKGGSGDFYEGAGGGFNPLQGLLDLTGKIGNWVADKFPGGGKVVEIAQGLGSKTLTGVTDWVKGMIPNLKDMAGAAVNTVKGWFGGGSGKYRGIAAEALKRTGDYSDSNLDALMRRMKQESGYDPNAVNNWDSNAKRGTPSKGLMQVIGPTFDQYRDKSLSSNIMDPLANIVASINYTKSRYGSVQAGWNRQGGYADGGLVQDQRSYLYDRGGVLNPGLTSIVNATRKPEAILTGQQWQDVHQLAMAGGGSGGNTYQFTVPDRATARDFFEEAQFQARRNSRGGAGRR